MDEAVRLSELDRLGGGREAEIFSFGEGRVLRLARDPRRAPAVEREISALTAARRAGAPVPAVYGRLSVEGRPGTVIERLDGEDLLLRLGRRPWSVWSIGRTLGRVHARLHGVEAPAELPRLSDELRGRLSSELVPADLRESALARLDRLPNGRRLCHGDFHPANLLPTGDGYAVIDWTVGSRGDPAADVARTRLLITLAELPADAPRAVRWLHRHGRRLLLAAYMAGYRSERPLDRTAVEQWSFVCAAARLADDIPAERESLLRALIA
ncbi:MAG TPA: phosphotransferase [Thermoleophilaceae bacterium]|nr:phosphotransferase [Thermoleophilaceae bacterium]